MVVNKYTTSQGNLIRVENCILSLKGLLENALSLMKIRLCSKLNIREEWVECLSVASYGLTVTRRLAVGRGKCL